MDNQQLALIIPAAGAGERIGGETPKPYLKFSGTMILEHTLTRFKNVSGLGEVIVSTSGAFVDPTKEILDRLFPNIRTVVVEGGKERQDSIRNAMKMVSGKTGLIAVHDAVRPFVDPADIEKCIEKAIQWGGAVLAVPAKDTLKIAGTNQEIVKTPDRNQMWHAQTPQVFWAALLREAYNHADQYEVMGSDDSSLVEKVGGKVVLVEGSAKNFKITFPLDLQIAGWLQKEGLV